MRPFLPSTKRLLQDLLQITVERDQLAAQVRELEERNAELSGAGQERAERRANDLEVELAAAVAERETLRASFHAVTQTYNATVGSVNALTGQVNELTGRNNELVGVINELTGERNALCAAVNELTDQRNRAVESGNSLTHERNELTDERNSLVGSMNRLTQERNELIGQQNRLVESVNGLTKQRNEVTDERNRLVGSVNSLTQERNELTEGASRISEQLGRQLDRENLHTHEREGLLAALSQVLGYEPSKLAATFINSNGQSGTHLARKCLSLLGGVYVPLATNEAVGAVPIGTAAFDLPEFHPDTHVLTGVNWPGLIAKDKLRDERLRPLVRPGRFGASHVFFTPAAARMFEELDLKMILVVREARDWAYSAARKIAENPSDFGRPREWTLRQHLKDCVFGFESETSVGRLPMLDRYERMSQWFPVSSVLTVRFEDLVGPLGGGSTERVNEALQRIARHVGAPIDDEHRERIARRLFGGTETFRSGRIGRWTDQDEFFRQPRVRDLCDQANEHFGYTSAFAAG